MTGSEIDEVLLQIPLTCQAGRKFKKVPLIQWWEIAEFIEGTSRVTASVPFSTTYLWKGVIIEAEL